MRNSKLLVSSDKEDKALPVLSDNYDNTIKLSVKNSNILVPSGKEDKALQVDSGKYDNDMDL